MVRSTVPPPSLADWQEISSQQRFQDLINAMGAFFASVERDAAAQKKASVIVEILDLMRDHGLSVDDLSDEGPDTV